MTHIFCQNWFVENVAVTFSGAGSLWHSDLCVYYFFYDCSYVKSKLNILAACMSWELRRWGKAKRVNSSLRQMWNWAHTVVLWKYRKKNTTWCIYWFRLWENLPCVFKNSSSYFLQGDLRSGLEVQTCYLKAYCLPMHFCSILISLHFSDWTFFHWVGFQPGQPWWKSKVWPIYGGFSPWCGCQVWVLAQGTLLHIFHFSQTYFPVGLSNKGHQIWQKEFQLG